MSGLNRNKPTEVEVMSTFSVEHHITLLNSYFYVPFASYTICRWQLHAEGGPVAHIVTKLLQEAEKSPRLMALVSLQLAKLTANNPAVAKLYSKEYVKMLLYGPPMSDNSFPGTALEVAPLDLLSLSACLHLLLDTANQVV